MADDIREQAGVELAPFRGRESSADLRELLVRSLRRGRAGHGHKRGGEQEQERSQRHAGDYSRLFMNEFFL
jgi:hypothetical protein